MGIALGESVSVALVESLPRTLADNNYVGKRTYDNIARSQTIRTIYKKIVFKDTIFRTMLETHELRSRLATLREENIKERLLS